MRTQADCRRLAEDCMHLAQSTSTPQHRRTLLHVANTWLYLADQMGSARAGGVEDRSLHNGEQLAQAGCWRF
jgi:hypothetical protein